MLRRVAKDVTSSLLSWHKRYGSNAANFRRHSQWNCTLQSQWIRMMMKWETQKKIVHGRRCDVQMWSPKSMTHSVKIMVTACRINGNDKADGTRCPKSVPVSPLASHNRPSQIIHGNLCCLVKRSSWLKVSYRWSIEFQKIIQRSWIRSPYRP